MIEYRIRPLRPEAHLFEVTLTVANPTPEGQAFTLPAWIPGSYMIRDFARHLVHIEASCHGETLPVAKIDKQTWQLPPCDGAVQVQYQIYAWDLSVRGAHLDTTHGYFNGTCVFLAAMGHEDQPCEVEIEPPEGSAYVNWRVATGLTRLSGSELAFGRFQADNYDALIDHPVEMGPFEYAQFEACGVPHLVALAGRHRADMARLCRDLKPICEHHIRMFGEPAPMDHYVFMTLVTGSAYGGLEHRNSTSLMCARDDLPKRTDDPAKVRDGYRSYLGLCSHEYFHTWNIKRIKPAAFTPFDLSREVHTELLWAFEGITSYYDDLSLTRTGLIPPQSYLELLGQIMTRVYRGQGRHKQTVTESSFDAWTRFYKQDENAPNAIVSYYTKGSLIALALDLTLRNLTDEKRSLDDLMRLLWQRYGQTGEGVPEQGVQALAEEVAGCDMGDFFSQALYSTEDLPLAELLAERGVELNWRSAAGHGDNGGKPGKDGIPNLGARLVADPMGAKIAVAFEQGPAMAAGLSAGDVIIAVDGLQATQANIDNLLAAFLPGETVEVHAFRRDELMKFRVEVAPTEPSTAYLTIAKGGLTEKGKAWLHAK
ncbi:MAG: PDZ domain-containing protein [Pseudomonadales bacterium]|nr:PDZ domain-containing protein [Pseudomonadales bacterium]